MIINIILNGEKATYMSVTIVRRVEGNNHHIELAEENLCGDGLLEIDIAGDNHSILFDKYISISGCLCIYIRDNNSTLTIGSGTTFESAFISIADDDNFINIGSDCMFAKEVRLMASDFHSIIDIGTGRRINNRFGIEVKDHVWIGYGVTILKNNVIGSNSILSAHALVTKSVPPNTIVGGCPAKVVRQGISWCRERIKNTIDSGGIPDMAPDPSQPVTHKKDVFTEMSRCDDLLNQNVPQKAITWFRIRCKRAEDVLKADGPCMLMKRICSKLFSDVK